MPLTHSWGLLVLSLGLSIGLMAVGCGDSAANDQATTAATGASVQPAETPLPPAPPTSMPPTETAVAVVMTVGPRLTPTPLPTLVPTATVTPEPTATPGPTPTPNPYASISLVQSPVTDADPAMYLTFDDGPHPEWTMPVLDLLDEFGVTATFFVVGQEVARYPEITAEIDARGHSLANHTWRHRAITTLSDEQLIRSVSDTSAVIEDVTGQVVRCFRPPFADINGRTRSVVQAQGLDVHIWDVGSLDWEFNTADPIVRSVLPLAPPGSDILMHDGGGNRSATVEALRATVEALRNILEVWSLVNMSYEPLPGCETS